MPSISSASRSEESGACSGGLTTMVLPAASGAADLPAQNMNGWLNGMMRPTTPQRLAHREVHRVRPHRDRCALHLGDEAGEELELRRRDGGVADHLGIGLPQSAASIMASSSAFLRSTSAMRAQHLGALERQHAPPLAERGLGGGDRGVDVVRRRAVRDLAERLAGAGIDGVDVAASLRLLPLAGVIRIAVRRQIGSGGLRSCRGRNCNHGISSCRADFFRQR